jgi:hypothetical protein
VSLLAPWLLFPATLSALAVGCGLLLERVSTTRLPGALLAPLGLAAMIVVAGFTTHDEATARFTVPLIVGLAAAGLAVGAPRFGHRGLIFPAASAVVVFAVFAAPVVLSGEATFAGYIKLDDTATFLALTDRVFEHGPTLSGLAPSSYEATLAVNLAHGYPVGALLPFGVGRELVGVDSAWLYQPYLAFAAALLALVLYELCGSVVQSRSLRVVISVVAAQPALLYGYALWGGIKELVAAPLLALVAALVASASSPRRVLPLATASAALVSVLSAGGVVWLVVPAVVMAFAAIRNPARRVHGAYLVGSVMLLSLPSLLDARSFFDQATESAVRSGKELGNLVRPLNPLQVFGIWPTGDFRVEPLDRRATWILIAVAAAAGMIGVVAAWRRRAPFVLYLAAAGGACIATGALGSPWVAAKAYAIASPAFISCALVGCTVLLAGRRRTEGGIALAALAGGVVCSNVFAFHDVNLAPRQQLAELEQIGHRFAGQGPALMTEYQPYGVRHFLRRLDAEGASELRRRPILLRNGAMLAKGEYAELASFQPSAVLIYRTLVLRRSPFVVRPDERYGLVWRGRFYDVWQQGAGVSCTGRRTLAGRARGPLVVELRGYPSSQPRQLAFQLTRAGRYSVWVGGSFRNRLSAFLDERMVGSRRNQLNNAGQYTRLGDVNLSAGPHIVELHYEAERLMPGSGGPEYGLGPLVISPTASQC